MAKRNFIPLVPSGTINADASVAQLEQDVLAMDAKVGELAEDIGDTEQEINQLKSQINEVESSYPQKSAQGAIVTIDDGADNVPVVSLEAEINPVQDLHGYDNPWPAGGGKNKCPDILASGAESVNGVTTSVTSSGEFTFSGTSTISGGRNVRKTINFTLPAGTYTLSVSRTGTGGAEAFLQSNGSIIAQVASPTVTLEADTVCNVGFNCNSGVTYNETLKIQVEAGPSATTWQRYSNICPISGFTGANIFDTGQNLCQETRRAYINTANSVYAEDGDSESALFFAVKGVTYTISSAVPLTRFFIGRFVGSTATSGETLAEWVNAGAYTWTATWTGLTCWYVLPSKNETFEASAMINVGSSAAAYTPYVANVVNISWETEAGTVYGGTMTLNQDGTADLTSNLGFETLKGTETVTESSSTNGYMMIASNSNSFMNKYAISSSPYPVPVCSQYKGVAYAPAADLPVGVCDCFMGANGKYIGFKTPFDEVSEFTAYLAAQYAAGTPVTFALLLAEPVTYHIEDVELVKTLYGFNNLWCDTGDIDLVYRADPATYTSEQIRIMLNAMVAPVEASTTASKAYSVNELLIMDGTLYKVIANIANGGTITPNTNVSATTVGEQLTAILNS